MSIDTRPNPSIPSALVQQLPPLPTKTIVITGGSGFIGAELAIRLANVYSKTEDPYRYVVPISTHLSEQFRVPPQALLPKRLSPPVSDSY